MSLLDYVRDWQPFRIDALGIVTLLGGSSLQRTLGRLVFNPWTEYLPLLAAQVVLENTIAETIPGFVLYNITDRIKATDLCPWFARWLLCQKLAWSSTILNINVLSRPRSRLTSYRLGAAISVFLSGFLVSFTVLLGDWYGLACTFSIIALTAIRASIVQMYRNSVDKSAEQAYEMNQSVKLILTLPTGKIVTIYTTRGVVLRCLLVDPHPQNPRLFFILRSVGWVAFGVFIVTMGMASLPIQLILIVCTILPSVLVIHQFQCNEAHVGSMLNIARTEIPGSDVRAKTYAALELSHEEEDAMISWEFFPLPTNTEWWEKYKIGKSTHSHSLTVALGWQDSKLTSVQRIILA